MPPWNEPKPLKVIITQEEIPNDIPDQPIAAAQNHTYTEIDTATEIHDDLRAQHPEWIEPTGECPTCNEHEARLRKLLDALTRKGPNESVITTQNNT